MRILVLGAQGMLGHMACRVFATKHHVIGSYRGHATSPALQEFLPPERYMEHVDLTHGASLRQVLDAARPDVVLNCAGWIKQKDHTAVSAVSLNALLPHQLASLCSERDCKLIQLSTDCVFSGRRGAYTEDDIPDPVDFYGRSKLLGEVSQAPHLTIRTSLIGRQLHGAEGLIEWFMAQRGAKVRGFTRAIFSGLTTQGLCNILERVLQERPNLSGLYHVAAAPISKYELLRRINDLMGLEVHLTEDDTLQCDRSLSAARFLRDSGGVVSPSWDTMLNQLTEDSENYERWRT